MKLFSGASAKTVSGAATGAIRQWVDPNAARKQARESVQEARKQARRQVSRARVAAAKARASSSAKTSGISKKAVGAAGAVGLAAGYFLDPESGKRRRNVARDRALALIRRGSERTRPEAPNDQAPAERVKSEIVQPADVPKSAR